MFKGGYMGKVLRINLTTKEIKIEDLPENIAKSYMGGAGFGIKYLFDEVPGNIDPLGPDNKLIFAPGPLSGTSVPCASRMALTTKSPLTGAVGMALSGGFFPVELKFAGYDILIIEGKSETPVYVWINNDKVTIRKAEKFWGMDTFMTESLIKQELHEQCARVACIGPAGEKLSKMAAIINERRAFGRKGVGAVMGSKNLKAIAVRGTNAVPIADDELFGSARIAMLKTLKSDPRAFTDFAKFGSPATIEVTSAIGIFPSENYKTTGEIDYTVNLGAAANLAKTKGHEFCYKCPVGCTQLKLAEEGKYQGIMSDPEYETLYSFGGVTGVDNLDSIIYADQLCDKYGLDTMSVGVTIAFAMELFEQGILTVADTNGVELKFGNHEAMNDLITEIAFRRDGLGALLCDGSKAAAEKLGGDTAKYTMHIKGLELPAYDPRGAKSHGLNYATSYTGADHNRGYAAQEIFGVPDPKPYDRFSIEGKGWLTKYNQDNACAIGDCPTICSFMTGKVFSQKKEQELADILNGTTGLGFKKEEIGAIGERVVNLARVFNVSAGFTRADDTFPVRIMTEAIKDGSSKGQMISQEDLDTMLDEYYAARGWTNEGVPTKEKLMELGLEDAIPLV